MTNNKNTKKQKEFDLEERSFIFAKDCRLFVNRLFKTVANIEDGKQLIKASGSVGANYIEANEAIGKKDFIYRAKVCRKEVKESRYWLKLVDINNNKDLERKRNNLIQEATELTKIFNAIIKKSE